MRLLDFIKLMFSRLFFRNPEEATKRAELRKIHTLLDARHAGWYRARRNLVLPGFAEVVLEFARLLKPLSDVMRATIASGDQRVAQRFIDFLIESRLSPTGLELRRSLFYDAMAERLHESVEPEVEFDRMDASFRSLLDELEGIGPRKIDDELDSIALFKDVCRYDFERLLTLFDSGVSLDDRKKNVEFSPVEGEQVLPDLLDLEFVLEHFSFEPHLEDNIVRLVRRRSEDFDGSREKQLRKVIEKLARMLEGPLSPSILLALVRAAKGDPRFVLSVAKTRGEQFESYRRRLAQQYEKDRERLLGELHENAVSADISTLFGSLEVAVVEGYDEETDAYIRQESPGGLLWIKPLRVLRTFANGMLEPIKTPLERLLVEGYFGDKVFQNNLANVLYQCQRTESRIMGFEQQLAGNGRISTTSLRRYVEELKRGKDISPFLTRLVDGLNAMARELVVDEAPLFVMLSDSLREIVADSKKPSPELVTNIRTFWGARNKEIMSQLGQGRDRLALFAKIMRSFGVVPSAPGPVSAHDGAPSASSDGMAPPAMEGDRN